MLKKVKGSTGALPLAAGYPTLAGSRVNVGHVPLNQAMNDIAVKDYSPQRLCSSLTAYRHDVVSNTYLA